MQAGSLHHNMLFDPTQYGAIVARLLTPERVAALGPGETDEALRPKLAGLEPADLFAGKRIADDQMASACLAGLWLYHDFLDESHALSQEIPTASGSFWHGIMHRREPDYGNAKYWFRRVGKHPVDGPLSAAAREITAEAGNPEGLGGVQGIAGQAAWDALAFVDACQRACREHGALEAVCRQIQLREWQLLFDYCYRAAVA